MKTAAVAEAEAASAVVYHTSIAIVSVKMVVASYRRSESPRAIVILSFYRVVFVHLA